jgi:hypothetical protein
MNMWGYIVAVLAVISFIAVIVGYHHNALNEAYEQGRIFEQNVIAHAVIDTKIKEDKTIQQVQEAQSKIKIVYRDRVKYVRQSHEDFLNCIMSDDLFLQLNSIHSDASSAGTDETLF